MKLRTRALPSPATAKSHTMTEDESNLESQEQLVIDESNLDPENNHDMESESSPLGVVSEKATLDVFAGSQDEFCDEEPPDLRMVSSVDQICHTPLVGQGGTLTDHNEVHDSSKVAPLDTQSESDLRDDAEPPNLEMVSQDDKMDHETLPGRERTSMKHTEDDESSKLPPIDAQPGTSVNDSEMTITNVAQPGTSTDDCHGSQVTPQDAQPIVTRRGGKKKFVSFRQRLTNTKDAKKFKDVLKENMRLKKQVKSLKIKNADVEKKLKNLTRVQKKKVMLMPTPANESDSDTTEVDEVSETVEVLEERLETMKKKKDGFYAPKGSFPIKESVKKSILATYENPEQAIYGLLEKLYTFNYMEIHKKTHKEATKGSSLRIAMDPKELKAIRDAMKEMYPRMKCGKDKLSTVVEGNITSKFNKRISPETTKWLKNYQKLVKDLEKAIDEQ